jgi:DeoR/GlpR family transcriptional regulator of sugar metabolism
VNARDRRGEIASVLSERPVSVEELAGRYRVSLSTIRRDLEKLSQTGQVLRTYGGARTAAPGEKSLREREKIATRQKAAIGRLAATFVAPGTVNILDAGTTAGALASRIADRSGITVITNGLTTTHLLEDSDGIELVVIGGSLRHMSSGMVGPLAEHTMSSITADAAFLSADGVTAARGLCEGTPEQAALKRIMVDNSRELYVVADSSKLGVESSHWWTALDRTWHLVTDDEATQEQLQPFRGQGNVEIHVAQTG